MSKPTFNPETVKVVGNPTVIFEDYFKQSQEHNRSSTIILVNEVEPAIEAAENSAGKGT